MNTCACNVALESGHLCGRCRAATAGRLTRSHALYRLLAAELQPAAGGPASFGRVRLAEAPLPVSERVLNLRGPGGMVGVLERWRETMQADRSWGAPAISGDIETRVARAARGLALNLDWIADSWPKAGQFATEVRDLDEEALAIVCPPDTDTLERGKRLGPCPAETGTGAVCGAVLRYYRVSSPRRVTCPWCEVVYPPHSWADLKAYIDHDEREVLLAG